MIIRILLIAIGITIAIFYLMPFLSLRILNAGNIFGLGICGLIIAAGVFFNPLLELIKKIWQTSSGKAVISAVTIIAFIGATLFFTTLGSIISHSKYTAADQTTVIVLGCKVRGSVPSWALRRRANAAVAYLNEHPDAVAIASGGQGPDEDISEAQCIFDLMTEAGIDEDRIYLENKSTSTDENIAFSKEIIDENGLSTNVAIATNDYHEKRAGMICEKNGMSPASLPAKSTFSDRATFFTREVFGVWAQWLKGVR